MTAAANNVSCNVRLLAKPPRPLRSLCIVMMTSFANAIAAAMTWQGWADRRQGALIQIKKNQIADRKDRIRQVNAVTDAGGG